MQKKRYLFLFIMTVFLVAPQLGFAQIEGDKSKLCRIDGNLKQIQGKLLQIQRQYLDSLVSIQYTNSDRTERCKSQLNVIGSVTSFLNAIRTEIRCALIFLSASQIIKDETKKNWHNITKQNIQHSIEIINSSLEGMAKVRPEITNTAALNSIGRANNFINVALTVLRKAEKEISQSLQDIQLSKSIQ
jgi:hypothetical protein